MAVSNAIKFELHCFVALNDHLWTINYGPPYNGVGEMGFWVPGFYFHFLLILPGGVCSSSFFLFHSDKPDF